MITQAMRFLARLTLPALASALVGGCLAGAEQADDDHEVTASEVRGAEGEGSVDPKRPDEEKLAPSSVAPTSHPVTVTTAAPGGQTATQPGSSGKTSTSQLTTDEPQPSPWMQSAVTPLKAPPMPSVGE